MSTVTTTVMFASGCARLRRRALDAHCMFRGVVFTLLVLAPVVYVGWSPPAWAPPPVPDAALGAHAALGVCPEPSSPQPRAPAPTALVARLGCASGPCRRSRRGLRGGCVAANCSDVASCARPATPWSRNATSRHAALGIHGVFAVERMLADARHANSTLPSPVTAAHALAHFNL